MLTTAGLAEVLEFDTCKIANAIEALGVRLRNEGFTRPGLRCVTGGFPAVIGYAATSRVRTGDPPMKGSAWRDLGEWWEAIGRNRGPRIAVIADADENPGEGAVVSDVHAAVLRALDCRAVITNGSVRNIPALAAMGFPAFARHVSPSHAYVHLIGFDCPVEIMGLQIQPGALLFADVHGVLAIPEQHLLDILRKARELTRKERIVIDLCSSPAFSLENLRAEIHRLWLPRS